MPLNHNKYRPNLHFSAKKNWINDPNGLVYFENEWHLFFQYNPRGDVWGNMNWGHAVSKNLIDWEELPIAIPEDEKNMIFSGSCVIDWKNTSGFGDGTKPPMVAIYTDHAKSNDNQAQSLAFSLDNGRSFTKYSGNPALDIGKQHFRDPKVFWHAPSENWIMVVAKSAENIASIYSSPNLINWTHRSDFGPAGANGHLWECPDLFPLKSAKNNETKWVFKIDLFDHESQKYSMAQVFFGDFDGTDFISDIGANGAPIWQRVDYGHDFYAAMSWSDVPLTDGRRIWIGWMNSHHYAALTPTIGWRGAMTLPRQLSFEKIENQYFLVQEITEEAKALSKTPLDRGAVFDLANGAYEIEISTAGFIDNHVVFSLNFEGSERLLFGLDGANDCLFVDRSEIGDLAKDPLFGTRQSSKRIKSKRALKICAIIDACSVEIFFDDGIQVFTEIFFAKTGKFTIKSISQSPVELNVWKLEK